MTKDEQHDHQRPVRMPDLLSEANRAAAETVDHDVEAGAQRLSAWMEQHLEPQTEASETQSSARPDIPSRIERRATDSAASAAARPVRRSAAVHGSGGVSVVTGTDRALLWSAGGRRGRTVTYADAGVSIHASERAVELLRSKVYRTHRPEVMGDIGGFAGLFRLDLKKYKSPILASSTGGVGTKLAIAQAMGIHDTVGIDLVAMVVNDLVTCGAEPLFLLDYIACGEIVPDRVAEIGAGIADGCRYAGCALLGGETAEHPGLMRPDEYDLSATGVGVVEQDRLLGRDRMEVGDAIIAMRSTGLHSNGYSLVRHVLLGAGRMRLDSTIDEFGGQRTLGEELLTPTRIYARDCLDLIEECEVHAFAHVTGGGITGNLVRVLPEHVDAVVDRSTWRPQPIFELVRTKGRIEDSEMESTFNMGVGMLSVVSAEDTDRTLAFLAGRGIDAWQIGDVIEGSGTVQMVGYHTRA